MRDTSTHPVQAKTFFFVTSQKAVLTVCEKTIAFPYHPESPKVAVPPKAVKESYRIDHMKAYIV